MIFVFFFFLIVSVCGVYKYDGKYTKNKYKSIFAVHVYSKFIFMYIKIYFYGSFVFLFIFICFVFATLLLMRQSHTLWYTLMTTHASPKLAKV